LVKASQDRGLAEQGPKDISQGSGEARSGREGRKGMAQACRRAARTLLDIATAAVSAAAAAPPLLWLLRGVPLLRRQRVACARVVDGEQLQLAGAQG
jgi:hypothetical protein